MRLPIGCPRLGRVRSAPFWTVPPKRRHGIALIDLALDLCPEPHPRVGRASLSYAMHEFWGGIDPQPIEDSVHIGRDGRRPQIRAAISRMDMRILNRLPESVEWIASAIAVREQVGEAEPQREGRLDHTFTARVLHLIERYQGLENQVLRAAEHVPANEQWVWNINGTLSRRNWDGMDETRPIRSRVRGVP